MIAKYDNGIYPKSRIIEVRLGKSDLEALTRGEAVSSRKYLHGTGRGVIIYLDPRKNITEPTANENQRNVNVIIPNFYNFPEIVALNDTLIKVEGYGLHRKFSVAIGISRDRNIPVLSGEPKPKKVIH